MVANRFFQLAPKLAEGSQIIQRRSLSGQVLRLAHDFKRLLMELQCEVILSLILMEGPDIVQQSSLPAPIFHLPRDL